MLIGQLPVVPTDTLINLLKLGQFGAALAMLLLGFYLHWQASRAAPEEITLRRGVAYQFMCFSVCLFILCMIGEVANSVLERHEAITMSVIVPPLDESNYMEMGQIDIVKQHDGEPRDPRHATAEAQLFTIHDGTIFTINLSKLISKLEEIKRAKQVVENVLPKTTSDLGPGAPQ
jgi:hypothetical protein